MQGSQDLKIHKARPLLLRAQVGKADCSQKWYRGHRDCVALKSGTWGSGAGLCLASDELWRSGDDQRARVRDRYVSYSRRAL